MDGSSKQVPDITYSLFRKQKNIPFPITLGSLAPAEELKGFPKHPNTLARGPSLRPATS